MFTNDKQIVGSVFCFLSCLFLRQKLSILNGMKLLTVFVCLQIESANIMAPSYFSISDIKNLSSLPTKRIRRPTVKVLENADTEASEVRTRHSTESESAGNAQKQDTDESDADAGLGLESEADRDESVSVRRGRRSSTTKAGVKNEAYKKPFEQGWKRELVYRGVGETSQGKRKADIYYFAPNNKKLRSMVEIDRHRKSEFSSFYFFVRLCFVVVFSSRF